MTPDTDAALAFYTGLIGWGTQIWEGPQPYTMLTAGGAPVGGVMAQPADAGAPPHWLGYISTPDVDATAAAAMKLKAATLVPPTDIPGVGRFAVLTDPQGAAFAIYTSANAGEEPGEAQHTGEFSWHELLTTDPETGFAFYESLFGWEKTSAMEMGDEGTYQMFGFDGIPFGGLFKKPADMPGPPSWQHYIKVDDVRQLVDRVNEQHGQVLVGPMEVPGGDWIANCMDPQGGMFSLHSAAK
jgi:predicted enzyme related to lactoylglutathione lyase